MNPNQSTNPTQSEATIERRNPLPPSNVPRGRQLWILLGVSLAVVGLAFFSTNSTPVAKNANVPSVTFNPASPESIAEFRKKAQEDEERLRYAQAMAKRKEYDYATLNAQEVRGSIPGQGVSGPDGRAYYPQSYGPTQQVDAAEEARKKKEAESLFASNIVFNDLDKPKAEPKPVAAKEEKPEQVDKAPQKAEPPKEKLYKLMEGTIIETALTNRLEGSFAGPVNCVVTTNVYSNDLQTLLIPQGARILGEAKPVSDRDQKRLAVTFHRIIIDENHTYKLDKVLGLDQVGETALKDKVDHHYMSTFGTSIAVGLLAGFSLWGTQGVYTGDATDYYRQGVSMQLGGAASRILERQLNRLPTITILEGHRVKILLNGDLELPEYHK